jgi:hypothetical protein
MGQSGHPFWEDDMTHNYTHGPSNNNTLEGRTFQNAKSHDLESHPMWWVLFVTCKHNPLA